MRRTLDLMSSSLEAANGDWETFTGEWSFGWILQGRAVQDVLYCPEAKNRYPGTTIRCYDAQADLWRVSWFDPHSNLYVILTGASSDEGDLVLSGQTPDRVLSFRWQILRHHQQFISLGRFCVQK